MLNGLESVLAELRDHDPWMQTAFLLNSNAHPTGERPLDVLRRGEIEPVLRAARLYGEQVAA